LLRRDWYKAWTFPIHIENLIILSKAHSAKVELPMLPKILAIHQWKGHLESSTGAVELVMGFTLIWNLGILNKHFQFPFPSLCS
jgi:hypothetical protein